MSCKRLTCRAMLVAFATVLLAACTTPPTPPFHLTELQPDKVLDVVEWLGSLHDLTQTAIVTAGLGLAPNPKTVFAKKNGVSVPNATFILDSVPITSGSQARINYTLLDLRGAAAHEPFGPPDSVTRATLDMHFYPSPICITKSMVDRRFGSPVKQFLITDGGGRRYEWRIGHWWSSWHTFMATNFVPDDDHGCATYLSIWQHAGPGTGL